MRAREAGQGRCGTASSHGGAPGWSCWGATALQGSSAAASPRALFHELGHNYGLRHSLRDASCGMSAGNTTAQCFNSPQVQCGECARGRRAARLPCALPSSVAPALPCPALPCPALPLAQAWRVGWAEPVAALKGSSLPLGTWSKFVVPAYMLQSTNHLQVWDGGAATPQAPPRPTPPPAPPPPQAHGADRPCASLDNAPGGAQVQPTWMQDEVGLVNLANGTSSSSSSWRLGTLPFKQPAVFISFRTAHGRDALLEPRFHGRCAATSISFVALGSGGLMRDKPDVPQPAACLGVVARRRLSVHVFNGSRLASSSDMPSLHALVTLVRARHVCTLLQSCGREEGRGTRRAAHARHACQRAH